MAKIAAVALALLGLGLQLGSAQRLAVAKAPVGKPYQLGNGTIPCDVEQLIAAHEGNKLCAVRIATTERHTDEG
jgi:hypothetical protein